MASACPMPDVAKITQILGVLFEGLQIKAGGSVDVSALGGACFGVFVTDGGSPIALCGADIALAASLGAALSMLPPASVKDAVKAHELTAVMHENVRETMNICTRLLMDGKSPHLRLDQVYPAKSLPPAAAALLQTPRGRIDFQLQLPKYGGGVLTLMSA